MTGRSQMNATNSARRRDCGLEFEATRDCCPWLALPAAIDFQSGLEFHRIRRRIAELVAYTRDKLDGRCGLKLATPPENGRHGALTAFRIPETNLPWSEIRQRFWRRGIEIPVIERPDYLLLRVSTHFYNTTAEIDRLAEVLPEALA